RARAGGAGGVGRGGPGPRDQAGPAGRRCEIVVTAAACRHFIDRHLGQPREPWRDWLPPALVTRLAAPDSGGGAVEPTALAELLALVEPAVRRCLERPLVLLYESYRLGRHVPAGRVLVLARGALRGGHAPPAGRHALPTA